MCISLVRLGFEPIVLQQNAWIFLPWSSCHWDIFIRICIFEPFYSTFILFALDHGGWQISLLYWSECVHTWIWHLKLYILPLLLIFIWNEILLIGIKNTWPKLNNVTKCHYSEIIQYKLIVHFFNLVLTCFIYCRMIPHFPILRICNFFLLKRLGIWF